METDATMTNKINVALALIAGLLGGLLTRYIVPPAAFAQNQAPITKEIRAQSFTLIDPSDHTVGTFTSAAPDPGTIPSPNQIAPGRPLPMRVVLRDSNGREIWSSSGTAIRPLSRR